MDKHAREIVLIAVLIALFCPSAWAQTSVQWTTNYYTVTGATLQEIQWSLRQVRSRAAKSSHEAYTVWQVNWQFSLGNANGRCRVNSFGTRTTITVTLPRWTAPTNAVAEVRENWQRYITALGQHEAGHAQLALAAAAELHKRVKEVSDDASCDSLRSRVDSLGQAIIAEYKNREKEYDRRTNHGIAQGATLRLRPRQEQ